MNPPKNQVLMFTFVWLFVSIIGVVLKQEWLWVSGIVISIYLTANYWHLSQEEKKRSKE